MRRKISRVADEELLGATPKQIATELRRFSRSVEAFSAKRPRLAQQYPRQWVGLYDGKIEAVSKSFGGVLSALKRRGIPPAQAFVQYLGTRERKLIL
jgi:hypothetical protein